MVRIRLEHAIGFIKGWFQSLKAMRVNIKDKKTHKFAMYWITACIGLYSFAMQSEDAERGSAGDADAVMDDPFIADGLSSASSSEGNVGPALQGGGTQLQDGKAKREHLKLCLFKAKDKRRRHHVQRQREELGLGSNTEGI
ncbi:hypothetical protein K438DRAFT_1988584 [Mycena galopus ATCC 62051]|nr:hypothetical protein K438DRAFT_1988584 [Mycena galopus ATCC 62051]